MSTIKLPLNDAERIILRKHKIKVSSITDFPADELEVILNIKAQRAKELLALAEFQTVPTIGLRFAEDLVFLGYYSLNELKNKNGAALTDEYEFKKGYQVDPCVEDQFRLAVHYAQTKDITKRWWDFTSERKIYRKEFGYPASRPLTTWNN